MAVLLSICALGCRKQDRLFRLSLSTVVMVLPFAGTLVFVMKAAFRSGVLLSGKIGLAIAVLSLGLIAKPVSDSFTRPKQERHTDKCGMSRLRSLKPRIYLEIANA